MQPTRKTSQEIRERIEDLKILRRDEDAELLEELLELRILTQQAHLIIAHDVAFGEPAAKREAAQAWVDSLIKKLAALDLVAPNG